MSESFGSDTAALVRRNRLWLGTGLIPLLLGFGFVLAAIATRTGALSIPALPMMLFGIVGTTYAYKSNKDPVAVAGTISADAHGIRHAGAPLVPRAQLRQGLLTRANGQTYVRFTRKGLRPEVLVRVKDAEEGHSLLRSLGFDATQSVAEIRAASEFFTWSFKAQLMATLGPVLCVLVPAFISTRFFGQHVGGLATLPVLFCFLASMLGLLLANTRVRVGIDGVATQWWGRKQFYPFSEIADVRSYRDESGGKVYLGVELELVSGLTARICSGQEGWLSVDPEEMLERIREARALHAEGGSELDLALLARKGRELGDWVTALRSIGAGSNAGMREPPVPADRLLRLIEDPSAPPLARVSAAVAALPSMDEGARVRVRVAAETTASRPLRAALERVLERCDDEAAMSEALAELEAVEAEREKQAV